MKSISLVATVAELEEATKELQSLQVLSSQIGCSLERIQDLMECIMCHGSAILENFPDSQQQQHNSIVIDEIIDVMYKKGCVMCSDINNLNRDCERVDLIDNWVSIPLINTTPQVFNWPQVLNYIIDKLKTISKMFDGLSKRAASDKLPNSKGLSVLFNFYSASVSGLANQFNISVRTIFLEYKSDRLYKSLDKEVIRQN